MCFTLFFPKVRGYYGLPKVKAWEEINPDMFKSNPELLESLQKAYNNDVDNIDLYIGGMLESNDGPGELFTAIIREQFIRLRQADRFWFENVDNGLVTVYLP